MKHKRDIPRTEEKKNSVVNHCYVWPLGIIKREYVVVGGDVCSVSKCVWPGISQNVCMRVDAAFCVTVTSLSSDEDATEDSVQTEIHFVLHVCDNLSPL